MRRKRKTIKKKKRSKGFVDDHHFDEDHDDDIAFKTKFVEAKPTIIIKRMNEFYSRYKKITL